MTRPESLLEPTAAGTARDAVLDGLCLHVEKVIDKSCCAILIFDDSGTRIGQVLGPAIPSGLAAAIERLTLELPHDVWVAADVRDVDVPASDAVSSSTATMLGAVARDFGLQVLLTVPIRDAVTLQQVGLLVVHRQHGDVLTTPERAMVREAAALAALVLGEPAGEALDQAWRQDSYRQLVETIPAITYVRGVGDNAKISFVSPRVEQVLGWTAIEYEAHPGDWLQHVHADDRQRVRAEVSHALSISAPLSMEYRVISRSGEVVWLRDLANLAETSASGAQAWHGVLIDVTREKSAESDLQRLAYYDSLTGLPNRRLCIDRIESVLGEPHRPDVALLFIDLDRFKFINDGIGHAAGDELLVAVARRLAERVEGHGSLARFGGDEFVAVLVDEALSDVEKLAGTLLSALRLPFDVNGYELNVEGTIGIAVASPDMVTPGALLRAADVALYRAKADGRGGFAVYDPRIDGQGPDRLEREAEFRRALASGEFQIAYQPVVDIETRKILAVEALLRWNHPERGILETAEFIGFADQTGLIVPLGKWVIEEACRQMRHWQDHYPAVRSLQVSVNLSGRQFRQASLAADVALILRQSGLSPGSLALEIKEGDALADSTAIAATLKEFRRLGVRVTIDDFGKGWSALGSLTRFTIDDLKIDGSCVSRLGQEQQDIAVVRALVSMAKAMGLDVTAGAVETSEQLAILRELGCDRAQGRHLAPPLMVDELERLFQSSTEFGLSPAD